MKTYKLTIELSLDEVWISDGFRPDTDHTKGQIEGAIKGLLGYAYDHEVKAKVTSVVAPKYTLQELEDLGIID